MKTFNVSDFLSINAPFEAYRIKSTKCVWLNKAYLMNSGLSELANKREFSRRYSYVIKDNLHFKSLDFLDNKKTLLAERYGGAGTAGNGGGSRCGNHELFQVKGVGANCLVGKEALDGYSDGTLHMEDAVIEIIMSEMLNQIMPIGCARFVGLIFTGKNAAKRKYQDELLETCNWGALAIREICLRPAHFISAPNFTPQPELLIPKDSCRVKMANRELAEKLETQNNFILFLGKVLLNYAKQFSFAAVNRISHGAVSASNLTLDGRWLDLSNASFSASGRNFMIGYGPTPAFYEEASSVPAILEEFLYTWSKYNKKNLISRPLINYYVEQFSSGSNYYVGGVLGLSNDCVERIADYAPFLEISRTVNEIIFSGKKLTVETPTWMEVDDPLLMFLESLFIYHVNRDKAIAKIEGARYSCRIDIDRLAANLRAIFIELYGADIKGGSFRWFIKKSAMASLKKFILSAFYYRERIRQQVICLLGNGKISSISDYMESVNIISTWFFRGADSSEIILYMNHKIRISYDFNKDRYIYVSGNENFFVDTFSCVIRLIDDRKDELSFGGFNFYENLQRLGQTISLIEDEWHE